MTRGEILKLGRIRLKVKDYRIEKSPLEADRVSNQIEDGPIDISCNNDLPKDENDLCRVCFGNINTEENPLFSPCNCTGTMKFIHFFCLKAWLNLKLASQLSLYQYSYYWKTFDCEICKRIYPCMFSYISSLYSTSEYQILSCRY